MKKPILKDGDLQLGQLIAFHWNSHKDCYSILEMRSEKTKGNVIGYCDEIEVSDAYIIFDNSKKAYTLRTHKKDRHTFIVGKFKGFNKSNTSYEKILYYNPLKVNTFVDADIYFSTGEQVSFNTIKKVFASNQLKKGNIKIPHIFYKN